MQYMLLIYDAEGTFTKMSEADRGKVHGEYGAFTEAIKKSGHMVAGGALQPASTATTVRVKDGKAVTTHGPFAETREQLGGYHLIEAKDLDEATMIAARIPSLPPRARSRAERRGAPLLGPKARRARGVALSSSLPSRVLSRPRSRTRSSRAGRRTLGTAPSRIRRGDTRSNTRCTLRRAPRRASSLRRSALEPSRARARR